jgi:hypothetical protein
MTNKPAATCAAATRARVKLEAQLWQNERESSTAGIGGERFLLSVCLAPLLQHDNACARPIRGGSKRCAGRLLGALVLLDELCAHTTQNSSAQQGW